MIDSFAEQINFQGGGRENRTQWIDAIKGFGIFLVTFAHLNPSLKLEAYVYSFHMCLFFFISGYLHNNNTTLIKYISKKAKSLLIPFVIWDFFATLEALLTGQDIISTILAFFIYKGQVCWNAPIWFLWVLFITEVLYALIMKINNSKLTTSIIFVVGLTIWIIWYLLSAKIYTLYLNLVGLSIMFYALGDLMKKTKIDEKLTTSLRVGIVIVGGIISVVFGAILNIRISYTNAVFGNIYYCIIAAISGTLFYFIVFKYWKWLGKVKPLYKMGQSSLIIMCTQYWFFKLYDAFSYRVIGISVWHKRSTLKAFVLATVTIVITVLCVELFKRVFRNRAKVIKFATYVGIR